MADLTPAVRADLAPTGKLRAAINYGNFILATKDKASGESRGVAIDLTREIGKRLGVPVEIVARSNGVSPMSVLIRTPFGGQITDPVVLTARVNNLTGLGRVVTVGLLIVLATWWLTYFKRRRRQNHEKVLDCPLSSLVPVHG